MLPAPPAHVCKGVKALWNNDSQGRADEQASTQSRHSLQVGLAHAQEERGAAGQQRAAKHQRQRREQLCAIFGLHGKLPRGQDGLQARRRRQWRRGASNSCDAAVARLSLPSTPLLGCWDCNTKLFRQPYKEGAAHLRLRQRSRFLMLPEFLQI